MAKREVRPTHVMVDLLIAGGVAGAALFVASSVADACIACSRWMIG